MTLIGNYHSIEKGNPLVALKELTGFEGEQFIINSSGGVVGGAHNASSSSGSGHDDDFFKRIQRYSYHGVLMTASSKNQDTTTTKTIPVNDKDGLASVKKSSIVPGHAYSILDIKTPMLTTSRIHLLKLRNPW